MIKLFWNTHNQIIPTSKDPNNEDVFNYKWGLYHKDYSDKWIYYLLQKIQFKIINRKEDIESEDSLIIVDSSIEKKKDFYTKLRLMCSKVFLIHLGDETGRYNLDSVYNNCTFVWKAFCLNKYFKNQKVMCLPIGYKSGVKLNKNSNDRKFKWSFIGTPHKSSRHDLLFQLSDINPSFSYKTQNFNEKILEVDEMNEILSSTVFAPCPNGFVHPETYRLYEALECECIPIVENAYKYYDRLFPNNPFIKIDKWGDAKKIIMTMDKNQIDKKREECKSWWKNHKNYIQEDILKKINYVRK